MKKTPQHNIPVKKRTKKDKPVLAPWMEEVEQLGTLKLFPVNEAYLETLAIEMLDWITKNTDVLIFEEYLVAKSILANQWNRWCNRVPRLQQYYDQALMILSTRREKGAITKKYDSGLIERSMPMYSQRWKELQVWRSKLNAEEDAKKSKVEVIVMEKFPEIPEKK